MPLNLKYHHSKDVNSKFQLKRSSRLDVQSDFVVAYISLFLPAGMYTPWSKIATP